MFVLHRATFESPQFGYEPEPLYLSTARNAEACRAEEEGKGDPEYTDYDPTGCLAEARFALDDALTMIGNYTCRILGNVTELESAKNYIRRAQSVLPGGA